MFYITGRRLTSEERERLKSEFSNGATSILGGRSEFRRYHGPCTQCGAPDETGAHLCAYCLSPRQVPARCSPMDEIEVTTLEDTVRRFVPAMSDETFRK